MDQETDYDSFHRSERGDIFDLYNACNGVLHNGLLDVRKLNELSKEEIEALDVARLREVWDHTASGCVKCESIITKLNLARKQPRKPSEHEQEIAAAGINVYADLRWEQ